MNRRDFLLRSGAAVSLGLFAKGSLLAQTPAAAPVPAAKPAPVPPPPTVTEFKALRRNTGIFTGRGGTIGWLVNKDAIVTIDTQFPETAALCLAGLPGRNDRTLDAAVDTHHHFDHTSGNKLFKAAAKMLVAQRNVPGLMAAAFERNPQKEELTFPDTLFDEVWRKDVGDEVVSAQYFGPAHTKGDIAVYFERANVLHVGDLVFNRLYPYIDRPGGASVRGWVKVLEEVARTYPKDALLVCGHGKQPFGVTGTLADAALQRDFFTALIARVEADMKAGKTKDEIVKLTNLPGFPDHFVDDKSSRLPGNLGAVYDELSGAGA